MQIECISCGHIHPLNEINYSCLECGDLLEVRYDLELLKETALNQSWTRKPISVWRYSELLPINNPSMAISLGEGGTSLHRCSRLSEKLGLKKLYVKNEGENPTGSFKDRGMTVVVTKALELNMNGVICASTGNTSASLAAYAAKAGLYCIVLIPSGKIAFGKLSQAIAHGAWILQVKGNFDKALELVMDISKRRKDVYLSNSVNPFRIEGQKTLAFEICNQLGVPPDAVVMPVGNAGNISAVWKGFSEFRNLDVIKRLPRLIGVQAKGAAPIANAVKEKSWTVKFVERPETIASAIRIGAPVSWRRALIAIYGSSGTATAVDDQEILEAQKMLARYEGLFVEPASATSIAAIKHLLEEGAIDKDELIVSITTGHGLKDPDIVSTAYEKPVEVEADAASIEEFLVSSIAAR